MTTDIKGILLSREQLAEKVSDLAARISADYDGKDPLIVGILKGSFIFIADLLRCVTVPCTVDFMAVSSYGADVKSSGEVRILKDLDVQIEGRHVLLVEDILDSGHTLNYLLNLLKARGAASVRLCSLLDKPSRRKVDVPIDYHGFSVPDEFVVGYGLDYAEHYRNLPFIGILKPEIIR